ncbi:MAG: hypothetical protein ABMB14_21110 [Myxococcota bacterium]
MTRSSRRHGRVAPLGVVVGLVAGLGLACSSLPSEQGEFTGPRHAGEKLELRERKPLLPAILPGVSTTPPRPEAAITSAQCGDIADGGPVNGPDCVTDTISCGQTIVGHTVGGVRRYDSRWYEKNFCWPRTIDHDGGEERIYRLVMPEGEWRAFLWMDSPCADLDLFAFKWAGDDCPTDGASSVTPCEGNIVEGVGNERLELVHQGTATWLVVVEGAGDAEGAFALHVQCRKGLQ